MTDTQKVIEKVKKLAAIANDPNANVNEAAAAAARMQALILHYKLELSDLEVEQEMEEGIIQERVWSGGKLLGWVVELVGGISRSNGCKCFLRPARQGWGQASVRAYGKPSDVATVKYLTQFYVTLVEGLLETWKRQVRAEGRMVFDPVRYCEVLASSDRKSCNAFKQGAASAISDRLHATRQEWEAQLVLTARATCEESKALVLVRQTHQQLAAYTEGLGLKGSWGSTAGQGRGHAYRDGHNAGSKAQLHGAGKAALGAGH